VETKARGDEVVTLAIETSCHDGKLAVMADPSKGNKLITTTACDVVAKKTRIVHPAAAATKGKDPAAMTRRTIKI
jgi:tRNA A37 threonylcarbamoyltransferase TsaD